MSEVTDLVQALSDLLWPLLAALLVWRLLPAIRKVIESRSFRIKVGDKEITVADASEQLRNQVADLQIALDELQQAQAEQAPPPPEQLPPPNLEGAALPEAPAAPSRSEKRRSAPSRHASWGSRAPSATSPRTSQSMEGKRVLWVDDSPENNVMLAQNMRDRGVIIDEAPSTREGLARLSDEHSRYDLVITDMARKEGSAFNMEAGLELLTQARAIAPQLPVIIYASPRTIAITRDRFRQFQAVADTASASELIRLVKESPQA